ncbi:CHAT domain-containing protein [Streptosporangiaceae bacterium NEAU-GS5]|nr:CHAT domain-containing protein [Streptosporangiaceae bacterium NEAU-GS5]
MAAVRRGVVACPGCSGQMLVEQRLVVDVAADADFAASLARGDLFFFTCRRCHTTLQIPHPVLAYHPDTLPKFLFVGERGSHQRDNLELALELAGTVIGSGPVQIAHVDLSTLAGVVAGPWAARPSQPAADDVTDVPPPTGTALERLSALYQRIGDPNDDERLDENIALCRECLDLLAAEGAEFVDPAALVNILGPLYFTLRRSRAKRLLDSLRGSTVATVREAQRQLEELGAECDQAADPVQWAEIQSLRGTAHLRLGELGHRDEYAAGRALIESAVAVLAEHRPKTESLWAAAVNNLALAAFYGRESGDDVELALAIWHRLEEQWTEPGDIRNRIALMMNFDLAYSVRTEGTREENQRRGIAYLQAALEMIDGAAQPFLWGMVNNNLAHTLTRVAWGDRATHLEAARHHLAQAESVLTPAGSPVEWGMLQANFGVYYAGCQTGSHVDNIERSIACFGRALGVLTKADHFPYWAYAEIGLASVLLERGRWGGEGRPREAARRLEEVLAAPEIAAHGELRFRAHYVLGSARSQLGDVEEALANYRQGAALLRPESNPLEWGVIHSTLSLALRERAGGDRAADLDEALAAAEQAVQSIDRAAHPMEWGMVCYNKALIHQFRVDGGFAEEGDQALAAYEQALAILTPATAPTLCAGIATDLGTFHGSLGRWPEASAAFGVAVEAYEASYGSTELGRSRATEVRQVGVGYSLAAYAAVRCGDLPAAITLAERGRARTLRESLGHPDLARVAEADPGAHAAYRDADNRVAEAERLLRDVWIARGGVTPADVQSWENNLAADAARARRDRADAAARIRLLPGFADFGASPSYPSILRAAGHVDALVYLLTTEWGSVSLIAGEPAEVVFHEGVRFADLAALVMPGEGEDGLLAGQLFGSARFRGLLGTLAGSPFARVGHELGQVLRRRGCHRIAVVAFAPWNLLPFHAIAYQGRSLLDDFEVILPPSAQALSVCHARREAAGPASLLAVGDIDGVPQAAYEIAAVTAEFGAAVVGAKPELLARPAGVDHVHLACHGRYSLTDPLESELGLGGGTLTVREILDLRLFEDVQLVFLSACQSAISDVLDARDEAVGMPAACIQSGAAGVVGTLWSVADTTTALLAAEFYRGSGHPAARLRAAQLWLRDVTAKDVLARLAGKVPRDLVGLPLMDPSERPFADPWFWAAFVFIGG